MLHFTEKSLVEDYIIQKLQEKGWTIIPAVNHDGESYTEPLLLNNLVRTTKRLNADKGIDEEDTKHTLNGLKLKGQESKVSSRFSTFLNSLCL